MEEDRFITVSQKCQLHYRIDRHATAQVAVVLIHGLSSNLTRWTEFLQHTVLSDDYSLLRVDLRGHGQSRYRGRLNTLIWAEDLQRLLTAEGIQQVIIVGHSLGARIAAEYARRYPEQCLGTVLLDPVVPEALQGRGLRLYRLRFVMKALIVLIRGLNRLGLYRRHIPLRDLHELDEKTRVLLASQTHESIAKQYMSPWIDLEFNPLANYLQDMYETLSAFPELVPGMSTQVLLSAGGSISSVEALERYFGQSSQTSVVHLQADHWPLTEKPVETRCAIEAAIKAIAATNPSH